LAPFFSDTCKAWITLSRLWLAITLYDYCLQGYLTCCALARGKILELYLYLGDLATIGLKARVHVELGQFAEDARLGVLLGCLLTRVLTASFRFRALVRWLRLPLRLLRLMALSRLALFALAWALALGLPLGLWLRGLLLARGAWLAW
jgi:hypothetical protein